MSRFFNRPVVLILVLLACIGLVTWKLWPLNQRELYERGARLMESTSLYDMEQAWADYLGPLERDYPDHPYQEEVAGLRRKWEAAKGAPAKTLPPSEAQRFFQQGELLQKQGDAAAAKQVWSNLIDAFGAVDAEKDWVDRARRALTAAERDGQNPERWKNVRAALERARELHGQGKEDDAQRIWRGIIQLYRGDPAAAEFVAEARKALGKK